MKLFFLSLKWQAAISVSLILLLGVGMVTYFGQQNLEQTYLNQRNRVFQDRQKTLITALETLQQQITNIANHMQGVAARMPPQPALTQPADLSGDRLLSTLKQNWDQLNFEWGLDAITLYSSEGKIIFTLGSSVIERLLSKELLMKIQSSESPKTEVRCNNSCWQFVAVPTLLDNGQIGVVVLSKDLSDVVLQFQSVTSADVGILVEHTPETETETETENENMLSIKKWQQNIVALTGAPVSYNILNTLAANLPMSTLQTRQVLQHWKNQDYEISLLHLTDSFGAGGASIIVVENVSIELERLNSTLANLFKYSFIILVLAEAALLWLLSGPMAQLDRVSRILPKLAGDERNSTLQELQKKKEKPRISNEIHRLFDSAVLLANTLHKLDLEVKLRTRNLKLKGDELLKERNFVTTLLNNVQTVILSQTRSGDIHQLNAEGCRLLSIDNLENSQENFLDFIEPADRATVANGLQGVFSGMEKHFHHEGYLCNDREIDRFIDWHHSRLPDSSDHEPLVLSVGYDLTARKQAETSLAWLADHDPLTELPNRRRFQIEFDSILKKSARSGQPGTLIYCDIDQFKTINDTSGHPAGDRLLQDIANKLKNSLREIDVLSRLGGDEFAIIAEGTDREGAIALVNKICNTMSDMELVSGQTSHKVTLSMGVVLFPEHGTTANELMANVDLSMYKAKTSGSAQNNWSIYKLDAPEKKRMHEQVDWKARIQKALEEQRFVLYYQPIYDISKGSASHYEALIRMLDEQGDIIPPDMFIPVAEKTGLIYDIDRYVLNKSVIDMKTFSQQGRDITLSINLSATAIDRLDFISMIENLVNQHGADRSRLIFELTETSAVADMTATAEVIRQCRRLGYQFSLDDFGSGYASWFYLQQLPVDFVKIDGSFVKNLSTSSEDRLFVNAINDVAQGLGKKTIAEFVENIESLEILRNIGVDYAQGYYIGKPMPELLATDHIFPAIKQTITNNGFLSRVDS